jgi:hypothetical protein
MFTEFNIVKTRETVTFAVSISCHGYRDFILSDRFDTAEAAQESIKANKEDYLQRWHNKKHLYRNIRGFGI